MSKKETFKIKGILVTDKPKMFEEALARLLDLYTCEDEGWEVDVTNPDATSGKELKKNSIIQTGTGKKKHR